MKKTLLAFICLFLLFAIGWTLQAAPAFVQQNYSDPQASTDTVSVSFAGTQTAGDLNVVVIGWSDTTAQVYSVTDNQGNMYYLAVGPTQYPGLLSQSIYYAINVPAGNDTITVQFTSPASYPDVRIAEYSGAEYIDSASGSYGESSTSSSGAITTSNADDLLIGASTVSNTYVQAAGQGYTSRVITSPDSDILEDEIVSATGSYSATAPLSFDGYWVTQVAAFKAIPAATGDPSSTPVPALTLAAISTPPGGETVLSDGNSATVQSAINAASPGSILVIPNGTWTWSTPVTINQQAVALTGQGSVTIQNANTAHNSAALVINKSTSGPVEVSNLTFTSVANVPGEQLFHIAVYDPNFPNGQPPLIHDCTFVSNANGVLYCISWYDNGGVVWSCHFHSGNDAWITGIQFYSDNSDWTSLDTIGTHDVNGTRNTYVEDCDFHDAWTASTNFDDNSRVVVRYCLFDNTAIGSHGQETSPWGCRHWEVYNNTFTYTASGITGPLDGNQPYPLNLNSWALIRGGTGVFTQNEFDQIPWSKSSLQLAVFSINRSDSIPCQTSYPAARQVGIGWNGVGPYSWPSVPQDGTGYFSDPIYIWGNTGAGTSDPDYYVDLDQYTPDDCGNGQVIDTYLQEGRDYFVDTPRPNYAPYPYPHPLRANALTNP